MFFRFNSRLATQDRIQAFPVNIPDSGTERYGPWIKDYEDCFQAISHVERSDKHGAKVTVFQAPLFNEVVRQYTLGLYCMAGFDEAALPDIWGLDAYLIVSERFKKIIEAQDDMAHQFNPVVFLDEHWQVARSEQTYYWFNLRRFLKVSDYETQQKNTLEFFLIENEETFFYHVAPDSAVMETLSNMPIWRYFGLEDFQGRNSPIRRVFYFNQELYELFLQAGITGLERYTQPYGIEEQSVAAVGGQYDL